MNVLNEKVSMTSALNSGNEDEMDKSCKCSCRVYK